MKGMTKVETPAGGENKGEISKDESMRKIGNSDFSTKPTNFYNLKLLSTDLCDSVSQIRIDL